MILLALFALISDAALERIELALQSSIQPLVVRTLPDEHEHQYDDHDDQYPAANTYDDRPPAGHRCASIRSRRVNVLQVTEIKEQVADTHLYTMTSRQIRRAPMNFPLYTYKHNGMTMITITIIIVIIIIIITMPTFNCVLRIWNSLLNDVFHFLVRDD